MISSSANWGQIIADYLSYPSIIGNYWQTFAIIAIICMQKSFAIICYNCTRAQNVHYCNYSITIIAIIDLCYQMFALLQLMKLFCIIVHY